MITTDEAGYDPVDFGNTDETEITVSGLTPGTSYWIQVMPLDSEDDVIPNTESGSVGFTTAEEGSEELLINGTDALLINGTDKFIL